MKLSQPPARHASPVEGTGPCGSPADPSELIQGSATAARLACEQMTMPTLKILQASVLRASGLPSRPGWERKAAAHAEIFRLLAEVAGHPATAGEHGRGARLIRDLMRMVGPAANGMILGSRQRLLACLRSGDPDGAARETQEHLHVLHYMARLAAGGATQEMAGHQAPLGHAAAECQEVSCR